MSANNELLVDKRRCIAVAPRSGPSQRVEIRVQDDGSVWTQVTKPPDTKEGLLNADIWDQHTRLFDQLGFFDSHLEDTVANFDAACRWAEGLLDFSKRPPA